MLSIVIPIHNEEPSLLPLYDRLTAVLDIVQKPYEILFVDDASTDRSFELLANLVETDERLKVMTPTTITIGEGEPVFVACDPSEMVVVIDTTA